ncbi:conserved hypothetical protein [Turicibacter sanguinis PC909]|jgi:hypothetical protein|uniref:Uncharacterized protein n=3 Tax=Turicibacteraceae TaxID=2810281 RepID=A0ABN0A4Q1_9FIRM|nr:conserved hypothetical protein [Turicibacter sanguinis PC909]
MKGMNDMSEMISMKCGCEFENGQAVADKVRMKGFADKEMPTPATINCSCGETYTKLKLVDQCPNCNMTYAVTPCSADDHQYIVPAGLNY